jgi:hypothetical protein
METIGSSEMSVTTYKTTRCHNQEDNSNIRHSKNKKSHIGAFHLRLFNITKRFYLILLRKVQSKCTHFCRRHLLASVTNMTPLHSPTSQWHVLFRGLINAPSLSVDIKCLPFFTCSPCIPVYTEQNQSLAGGVPQQQRICQDLKRYDN